jgi:hypothetical protein
VSASPRTGCGRAPNSLVATDDLGGQLGGQTNQFARSLTRYPPPTHPKAWCRLLPTRTKLGRVWPRVQDLLLLPLLHVPDAPGNGESQKPRSSIP